MRGAAEMQRGSMEARNLSEDGILCSSANEVCFLFTTLDPSTYNCVTFVCRKPAPPPSLDKARGPGGGPHSSARLPRY